GRRAEGRADDAVLMRRNVATCADSCRAGSISAPAPRRSPPAAAPVQGQVHVARECPCLVEAAPYFQQRHWDATFELGVDLASGRDARIRRLECPAIWPPNPAASPTPATARRRSGY